MTEHLLLPETSLHLGVLNPAYETYLREWREQAIVAADDGEVAASICLQGMLIDLVMLGKPNHPWIEVMDEFLLDDGKPLAYSHKFSERLHKFGKQYKQTTIQSVHTRWWIECLYDCSAVDHEFFADIILSKKQTDNLIYDADVSPTILRHRMKVELTQSMAMSVEILAIAGKLTDSLIARLATAIVDVKKCPTLGYMSMEYFRYRALKELNRLSLFPGGIETYIEDCALDLDFGWCDFAMKSKVDAYMGTAKRTQRDTPIHSPLTACHVDKLSGLVTNTDNKNQIRERLVEYSEYLQKDPLSIPAFQMRDVVIDFGASITPIEAIAASHIIGLYGNS